MSFVDSQKIVQFIEWMLLENNCPGLNPIEAYILKGCWERKTYADIAKEIEADEEALKAKGAGLFKSLRKGLKIEINKAKFYTKIKQIHHLRREEFESFLCPEIRRTATDKSRLHPSSRAIKSASYRQAVNLLTAAGRVESRAELKVALQAVDILKASNAGEDVALLLCKIEPSIWGKDDTLGKKAYRLGFANHTADVITWLLREYKIENTISSPDLATLCNCGGDAIWMSSNDAKRAIQLHNKSIEAANKDDSVAHLGIAGLINKSLCYIDLWELEQAESWIQKALAVSKSFYGTTHYKKHVITVQCILAYIQILLRRQEARERLDEAYSALEKAKGHEIIGVWSEHNLPIYLGKALYVTGEHSKAHHLYIWARRLAIANEYIQIEAQAEICIAYTCRKNNPQASIRKLRKAYRLSAQIGAQGNVAQAQIALGEIFRDLGQIQKSKDAFQQAERFYQKRSAPLQIEKIHQLRTHKGHT